MRSPSHLTVCSCTLPTVAKGIYEAVREICLAFPEAEELISHGFPDFRVRGKTFASYVVNHHGDGRVALWLNAPAGVQGHYTHSEPKYFFVPPYVGPRGWLGVQLNKGLSWNRIAALVRQGYEKVAPRQLAQAIGATIQIRPPTRKLAPSEVDPLKSPRLQRTLRRFRKLCLSLPDTAEAVQFGSPVWKVGKRTFAILHVRRDDPGERPRRGPRLQLYFWVGVPAQSLMTADGRFEIPAYIGHNGWIALDATDECDWAEVRVLMLESYRHFAPRRILKTLESPATGPGRCK